MKFTCGEVKVPWENNHHKAECGCESKEDHHGHDKKKVSCETRELVTNGGFEVIDTPFFGWTANATNAAFARVQIPDEGQWAAEFITNGPVAIATGTLEQIVQVTPGCRYQLAFAENLASVSGFELGDIVELTARVFFVGGQPDYINVPIQLFNTDSQVNKGYTFHEREADIALPCDVGEVTVRFEFEVVNNVGEVGIAVAWLLDAVSLHAV